MFFSLRGIGQRDFILGAHGRLGYSKCTSRDVKVKSHLLLKAIVCRFIPEPAPTEAVARPVGEVSDLAETSARAVEHQDPHVVKFTEACAREYALRPDPVYPSREERPRAYAGVVNRTG